MTVFTVDEAKELIDKAVFESEEYYKHDECNVTYVVPFGGKFYKFVIGRSYNYGLNDDFEEDPFEVKKVEKTVVVTDWVGA